MAINVPNSLQHITVCDPINKELKGHCFNNFTVKCGEELKRGQYVILEIDGKFRVVEVMSVGYKEVFYAEASFIGFADISSYIEKKETEKRLFEIMRMIDKRISVYHLAEKLKLCEIIAKSDMKMKEMLKEYNELERKYAGSK